MSSQSEKWSEFLTYIDSLPLGTAVAINKIAEDTGLHVVTIKSMLDTYEVIKQFPDIEVIKTSKRELYRFKKEKKTTEVLNEIKKNLKLLEEK